MPRTSRYAGPGEARAARPANIGRVVRAHIDIETAITPRVTSAIQVSSLLFSANQSAIDEYAAPLSLVLGPFMTGLRQLPKGSHWPGRTGPDQQIAPGSAASGRDPEILSLWGRGAGPDSRCDSRRGVRGPASLS